MGFIKCPYGSAEDNSIRAKPVYVTHVAVMKWEKGKNSPTEMVWATEKDVRLFVISKFVSEPAEMAELYAKLEKLPEKKSIPIQLDADNLAA